MIAQPCDRRRFRIVDEDNLLNRFLQEPLTVLVDERLQYLSGFVDKNLVVSEKTDEIGQVTLKIHSIMERLL